MFEDDGFLVSPDLRMEGRVEMCALMDSAISTLLGTNFYGKLHVPPTSAMMCGLNQLLRLA